MSSGERATGSAQEAEGRRYQRVKEVLFQALEQDPLERPAWVQRTCGSDASLRAEVEQLLARYETSGGFLSGRPELPPLDPAAPAVPARPPVLPERVGPYRILGRLGWGAMGVVYRAEQDQPRRQVALKVLRLDCVEGSLRTRFEREARALGRLSHPGIAQVFEAGVAATEAGDQPFLALELVDGGTLRQYCQEHHLGVRERIALVAGVCDAVQHAHERGVLHRDLKPDNVLVDAAGQPKVVDFGVARMAHEAAESLRTRTGQLLGTVAYMSPEQLRGAEVDGRTDQFALAVLLYELLTGHLPLESRGHTLPEALRAVAAEDPTPLATHDRQLGGDLDTVLLKALEADPARRYPTVGAFAADLRRYLEGRPIEARRPSAAYQLRKLIGRHRLLAASLGATLLALTLGQALALRGMRQARESEARLARERRSVLGLSNLRRVEALRRSAEELHPFGPALVPPLRAWLAQAEELRGHLTQHRKDLAHLQALQRSGHLQQLDAGAIAGASAWHLETLEQLVAEIERLLGENGQPGLVPRMRARLALSEALEARTLGDPAALWEATLAAIARPDSPYRGLDLEPQLGLVPLGPDPLSGLQEFLVYGTGSPPARDPATGQLGFEEESGLVLVLVPGGRFLMGVQRQDPQAPNYDPSASVRHEGPPREVELDPFLIGKHEVTQAQWLRLMESNPSYWTAGERHGAHVFSRRHPVEHVGRDDALDFLRRIGCDLPTEAQWEYATRAGGPAALPCESWGGREHVGGPERVGHHLPVGSFPPNAFGLHDTMGNVTEWCRDVYKVDYFQRPLHPGDGLVVAEADGDWSVRGGSFTRWENALRIGLRFDERGGTQTTERGFRAVRALSGAGSPSPAQGSELGTAAREPRPAR